MTKLGLGWSLVMGGVGVLLMGGCTTRVQGGSESGGGIQDPEGSAITPPGGQGGAGGAQTGAGGEAPSGGECPDYAKTILVKTHTEDLMRFDPNTRELSMAPFPPCGGQSLAVGRDGTIYTSILSGIRRMDPSTMDCIDVTSPSQYFPEDTLWTIAFARHGADGPEERLWVASMSEAPGPITLAFVDFEAESMGVVGPIGDGEFSTMVLAGTDDGRLMGIGQKSGLEAGNAYNLHLVEIDRADASIVSSSPMPLELVDPDYKEPFSLGIAAWGDSIYAFFGLGNDTGVVQHRLDGGAPDELIARFEGVAVYEAASTPCDEHAGL